MPSDAEVAEHRTIQSAAKAVLADLAGEIGADDTEQSIAARAYRSLCGARPSAELVLRLPGVCSAGLEELPLDLGA